MQPCSINRIRWQNQRKPANESRLFSHSYSAKKLAPKTVPYWLIWFNNSVHFWFYGCPMGWAYQAIDSINRPLYSLYYVDVHSTTPHSLGLIQWTMGWGFHFLTFALRWFIFSLGYSWSFAVQDVCFYQCLINRGYGADDRSRSRVIFHSLFQVSPKVERTGPRERQQRVAKFLLTAPIKSFHNQFLLSIWQRQVPSRTVFVRTPWRSCDAAVTQPWRSHVTYWFRHECQRRRRRFWHGLPNSHLAFVTFWQSSLFALNVKISTIVFPSLIILTTTKSYLKNQHKYTRCWNSNIVIFWVKSRYN